MGEDTAYVSGDIILQTLPSPGTGRTIVLCMHCILCVFVSKGVCVCVCASTKVCFPQ